MNRSLYILSFVSYLKVLVKQVFRLLLLCCFFSKSFQCCFLLIDLALHIGSQRKCSLSFLPHIHLSFFLATNHRWVYNSSAAVGFVWQGHHFSFLLAKDNHGLQNSNLLYIWKCPIICSLGWDRSVQQIQGSNTAETRYLSFSLTKLGQNKKQGDRMMQMGRVLRSTNAQTTHIFAHHFLHAWNDWQPYDAARRRRHMAVPAVPNRKTLTVLAWLPVPPSLCSPALPSASPALLSLLTSVRCEWCMKFHTANHPMDIPIGVLG